MTLDSIWKNFSARPEYGDEEVPNPLYGLIIDVTPERGPSINWDVRSIKAKELIRFMETLSEEERGWVYYREWDHRLSQNIYGQFGTWKPIGHKDWLREYNLILSGESKNFEKDGSLKNVGLGAA